MTDLLPCPLCGGDELSHGYVAGGGVEWGTAGCEACDLQVTKATEVQAIAAWNTRALASHIPAGSVDRALILAVEDFINEPRPYPSPEPMEVRDYRHSLYRVWSPLATALTAKPGDGEGLAVPATVVTGPKTVSFVGSPPEGMLTPTQPIRTAEEALEAAAQAVADLNDEETRTGISADAFHRAGLAIRALASRIPAGQTGPALCMKCDRTISEHWDFPDKCKGFQMAALTAKPGDAEGGSAMTTCLMCDGTGQRQHYRGPTDARLCLCCNGFGFMPTRSRTVYSVGEAIDLKRKPR